MMHLATSRWLLEQVGKTQRPQRCDLSDRSDSFRSDQTRPTAIGTYPIRFGSGTDRIGSDQKGYRVMY